MHIPLHLKKRKLFLTQKLVFAQSTKADIINLSFLRFLRKPRLPYDFLYEKRAFYLYWFNCKKLLVTSNWVQRHTLPLGFRKKSTRLSRFDILRQKMDFFGDFLGERVDFRGVGGHKRGHIVVALFADHSEEG